MENEVLRKALGLRGSVTFESHTNLGHLQENSLSEGEGDEHIPAIAIEDKAPHKLTQADMATELAKEIHPAQDVIGQDSDDVEFCCRRLVAAVTTQLFSSMVQKGVRYGYICTGEAFIFVYIPDDPSSVQCALCRPELDVKTIGVDELRLTATAQVLAVTNQSIDLPSSIPGTPPTARPKHAFPLYRGRRPHNLSPFRMMLRYGCRPSEDKHRLAFAVEHEGEGADQLQSREARQDVGKSVAPSGRPMSLKHQPSRPTHTAPSNVSLRSEMYHQKGRIQIHGFCAGIRKQLAMDRGPDADCHPLYKAGSCGALFKVQHSSHGYTMVAKGVEYKHVHKLKHEKQIYDELRDLQGECIPVCLGVIQLALKYPYYHDGGIYTHMLFLSWAGEAIQKASTLGHTTGVSSMVHRALQAIHSKGVLHGDAEPRNILWNPTCQCAMLVDIERATIRSALSDVSANSAREKRRLMKTCFSKELQRITSVFEDNVA
ncbi:hypothetical protein PABG_11128 [Paracoccidioides brasiliensis Pb03]|nr:hypothetical protein PABG_11128 [Paracoccidioides brasiliensis Pb03]